MPDLSLFVFFHTVRLSLRPKTVLFAQTIESLFSCKSLIIALRVDFLKTEGLFRKSAMTDDELCEKKAYYIDFITILSIQIVKAYYNTRRKRIVTVNPTKSIRALLLGRDKD